MKPAQWDHIGDHQAPSWYLDPVAARQKAGVYRRLVERAAAGANVRRVLKTDLFEEAYGEDALLGPWLPKQWRVCGIDVSRSTARQARSRFVSLGLNALNCDVCHAPFVAGTFDLIISPSTLDHFDSREEFLAALQELAGLVSPGGVFVVTLDNPSNPLYHVLR